MVLNETFDLKKFLKTPGLIPRRFFISADLFKN